MEKAGFKIRLWRAQSSPSMKGSPLPKSMKTSGLVFAMTAKPNFLDKICFPSSGSEMNSVGFVPFQYINVSPIINTIKENLHVLINAHLKGP